MSKKQGKKRCEDGSPHCRYKVEQNPLMRINFNTSRENISCFIDQQKTGHKDRLIEESGMSVKKNMRQQVSVWPVHK